uniref:Uncharacterized protein n=1 Tax=Siphoviridae sp. ctUse40 TaxID=2826356 RepID=A0A8S5NDN6_9CAUD|nr:MAG TPA: hypothetical protein [Siphoviridae sp. ctUse40]
MKNFNKLIKELENKNVDINIFIALVRLIHK